MGPAAHEHCHGGWSTAQHWVGHDLDSFLQQHSSGLMFMPVYMPGSLWAWPWSHILEAILIWTLLGWGWGLSVPSSLAASCFCAPCGSGMSRRVVGTAQLPAWASCGVLVVSGCLRSSGGMWMMVTQPQLPRRYYPLSWKKGII